ncbi:MAG: LLM class flavin-dependent oxidoreductase [Gordonia sp. (in: high G+C Gram-positive bacteria)]
MSFFVELAVGTGGTAVSLDDADKIAAHLVQAGVTGLRLLDRVEGAHVLDPSVTAAYLAGRHDGLGFLVDVPTTHNAPYNLARRILSADRAGGGNFGVVLRTGGGDEVSDAVAASPGGDDSGPDPFGQELFGHRHAEYATVLTALWESFPSAALIGDQHAGVVADDTLINPIGHRGRFYRVAGPLDGPSSPQGRPILAVTGDDPIDFSGIEGLVDVVIVAAASAADVAREHPEVAVLAHLAGEQRVDDLSELLAHKTSDGSISDESTGIDGIVLNVGGDLPTVLTRIEQVVAALARITPAARTLENVIPEKQTLRDVFAIARTSRVFA